MRDWSCCATAWPSWVTRPAAGRPLLTAPFVGAPRAAAASISSSLRVRSGLIGGSIPRRRSLHGLRVRILDVERPRPDARQRLGPLRRRPVGLADLVVGALGELGEQLAHARSPELV